jgi:hypothetical protein
MTVGVGSPFLEYDTGHTASSELLWLEFLTFFSGKMGKGLALRVRFPWLEVCV